MGTVEGEPVVDHAGHKPGPAGATLAPHHGAVEDALTPVGVADPLVEDQDGAEILEVHDVRQQCVGQKVVDRGAGRVAGIARAEMPAGLDRDALPAEREVNLRIGGEELLRDANQRRRRSGNLKILKQRGREQLIHQNAAVLRVIAELDHVPMAVVRLQQVGLGASSHFSDVPDGGERHREPNAVT